ncbi:MAG: hypothetical protein FWD23_02795 [Oscillospiraceae bacterium]|nr:hypothetical protein [Oscillospiraceae bacterium]
MRPKNADYTPPQTPVHFPRTDEFIGLFRENKDGRYGIYNCIRSNKFKAEAIRATADEQNGYIRGGMVAKHTLSHVPVTIEPQDLFAAYALIPHTKEETDKAWRNLDGLPSCSGNYIHIALDYKTLLEKGIRGILGDIAEKPASAFYESMRLSLEAVLIYAKRYRGEAERLLAEEADPIRRFELSRIRDALGKVPYEPPATLFEAMQSLQLFHFAMNIVESHGISLGRVDYLLDGFYENDLAAGLTTPEEAALWIQLLMLRSDIMNGQADSIVLAGSTADGLPFCSDLGYFVLDGVRALRQRGPQIWLRYADDLPRSLLFKALVCLGEGTSHPGFFNDRAAVPALMRAGVAEEHAYDYVSCQCVEISPAGRSQNLCAHTYHNLAKPIEVLLNKGKPMIEDTSFGALEWGGADFPEDIPVKYENFGDFLNAYEKYLRYLLRCSVKSSDNILRRRPEIMLTLSSALTRGCIESGRALLDGGALYNQTFPNFTSLVTAADSLAAIRKCVYEDKRLTLEELAELCRTNFEGNENMRLYLLNKCPKYGNDEPEADSLAKFIYDVIADEFSKHKNVFGDAFAPQYFGFHAPETHAFTTAATPDGRRHGEAPAGTLGGDMGREAKGLTALFNSATSFDHTLSSGGLNVNARFSPTVMSTERDVEKMIDLLISYFHKGGMEVQINCISKETLLDAQKHPERHKDLCVRISGQSAYFIQLTPAFQEQIIKRVEHTG